MDPIPFRRSEPQSFNRYSYVLNNPLKFIDPNGEAEVLIWNAGTTKADGTESRYGHAAFRAEDGTYLSKFPSDTSKFRSDAKFHSYDDDISVYGRPPDQRFEISLPDEEAAAEAAQEMISAEGETWAPIENCVDAVEAALSAGGSDISTDALISRPDNLAEMIAEDHEETAQGGW